MTYVCRSADGPTIVRSLDSSSARHQSAGIPPNSGKWCCSGSRTKPG